MGFTCEAVQSSVQMLSLSNPKVPDSISLGNAELSYRLRDGRVFHVPNITLYKQRNGEFIRIYYLPEKPEIIATDDELTNLNEPLVGCLVFASIFIGLDVLLIMVVRRMARDLKSPRPSVELERGRA